MGALDSAYCTHLSLGAPFTNNAVFQRNTEIKVWGWDNPGQLILLALHDRHSVTRTDSLGYWETALEPMSHGGPYELVVQGSSKVALSNIMIGEVWLCSGQSNMEWPLWDTKDGAHEIRKAENGKLRLLHIPRTISKNSNRYNRSIQIEWVPCAPQTVSEFSGVGYHFGKVLSSELEGVTIGLIQAAWGGTAIQSWIPTEELFALPGIGPNYSDNLIPLNNKNMQNYHQQYANWVKKGLDVYLKTDADISNWHVKQLDDSTWKEIELPVNWEQVGLPINGIVWFRKQIELPESWRGRRLTIELGTIDDYDTVFINSEFIGHTPLPTPESWRRKRSYSFPAELSNSNTITIAVRVVDVHGEGGFRGKPEEMKLVKTNQADEEVISLSGSWKYKIEEVFDPPQQSNPEPRSPFNQHYPGALYNGMISSLAGYPIKGVLWYQGESNTTDPEEYRSLFPLLISSWRREWNDDFHFLYAQLAPYDDQNPLVQDHGWAKLRQVQLDTLSITTKTGMIVLADIGDKEDIHPRNKLDVGKRFAKLASTSVYKKDNVEHLQPTVSRMGVINSDVQLSLSQIVLDPKYRIPKGAFEISYDGEEFIPAKALIESPSSILIQGTSPSPVAVRYCWMNYIPPEYCIKNKSGIPLSPFLANLTED
jgi:sialate O-acetylesterase